MQRLKIMKSVGHEGDIPKLRMQHFSVYKKGEEDVV